MIVGVAAARSLIVYACPVGELADQITCYVGRAAEQFGPNEAHAYMPHITVTGFFHDTAPPIDDYIDAIGRAMAEADVPRNVAVERMVLDPGFHLLAIASPWLEAVGVAFARLAPAATRVDAIRPKQHLHLSLAYGFDPAHDQPLAEMARALVQPSAPVSWDLCFYERTETNWVLHRRWPGAVRSAVDDAAAPSA